MSEPIVHETLLTIFDHEYTLRVTGFLEPYVPARILGPPEYCYPAEGGFFEISTIEVRVKGSYVSLDLPPDIIETLAEDIYEELADE